MKKKGNKKMPRSRQEIIDNPIPTSDFQWCSYTFTSVLKIAYPVPTNNRTAAKHINKDVGIGIIINDFLSRSRHLLVPLLFHEITSLHPPSFQRMICPLV